MKNSAIRIVKYLCLIAIALITFTGCRSQKSASEGNLSANATRIEGMSAAQRVDSLVATYADWEDVKLPVRLQLSAPAKFSVSAQCTMRHDQWIQFSVRMLGFEVARVWVDNDSIHAVDRYHKRYLSESVASLLGGNTFTVGNLQDLLLGRAFLTGSHGGTLTPAMISMLSYQESPEGLMVLPRGNAATPAISYGFILSDRANAVAAASFIINEKYAATASYTAQSLTPAGMFASNVQITTIKGKPIDASLRWDFDSAKWNSGENRVWETPKGYTRIPVSKLTSLLSAMK